MKQCSLFYGCFFLYIANIHIRKVGKVAKLSKKWLEKLQKLCKIRFEKLQNKQKSEWKRYEK